MKESEFVGITKYALEMISESRPGLTFVCFGKLRWARYIDDRSWSTVLDAEVISWWNNSFGRVSKSEMQMNIWTGRSGFNPPAPIAWERI